MNDWDQGTPDALTPKQALVALVIVAAGWAFAAYCCGVSV
jgi:hypothetical protein